MRIAPQYKWILCSLIIFCLLFASVPAWAEELGVVTGSTANIRTGPGTSNAILTKVSKGESFMVLAQNDSWVKIRLHNGQEGWISNSLLNVQTISGKKVVVKDNGINLRKGPSTSYAVVTKVQSGAVLTVLETKSGWHKVLTTNGVQAWIAGWLVTEQTNSVPPSSGGSTTANQVVQITGKIVNVRSGPGTGYGIVTKIGLNEKHQFLAEQKGWYKIQVGNKQGWVISSLAKLTQTVPATPTVPDPVLPTTPPEIVPQSSLLVVTGDIVNIRSAGNLEAEVLDKVSRGTRLSALAKAGDWYQVQLNSGAKGWIAAWLTEPVNGSTPSRGGGTEVLSAPLAEGKNFRVLDVAGRPTLVLEGLQQDQYTVTVSKDTKTIKLELDSATQINYDGNLTRLGVQNLKITPQGDKTLITLIFTYIPAESISFDSDKSTSYISIGAETSQGLAGKLIVVDPGHSSTQTGGWLDPGAIGPITKLQERDITLSISLKLKALLESAGARVIMTHTNSTALSLAERAAIANNNGAAIFVSIHANSSVNKSLSGHSTYFYAPAGDELLGSQRYNRQKLASLVQREMLKAAGRKDIGILESNFAVLRETRVPSILVETAFLSDREEEVLLGKDSFRQQLAEGVFRGIEAYFK